MTEIVTFIRRLYKSSNTYPYPRTHSLVVVPSTRPIAPEDDESPSTSTKRSKLRPPLNRAIPPIPESRSNDSIMTQVSERKASVCDSKVIVEESRRLQHDSEATCSSSGSYAPSKPALDIKKVNENMEDDCSIVIENKLAQNLAAKTPISITAKKSRLSETPKSPLMSVAHSVLSKLGNRFSRTEPRQNMRTTTSMSSMRRQPSDEQPGNKPSSKIGDPKAFKKSASMEAQTTSLSPSNDSLKSAIPTRTMPVTMVPAQGLSRLPEDQNNEYSSDQKAKGKCINNNTLLHFEHQIIATDTFLKEAKQTSKITAHIDENSGLSLPSARSGHEETPRSSRSETANAKSVKTATTSSVSSRSFQSGLNLKFRSKKNSEKGREDIKNDRKQTFLPSSMHGLLTPSRVTSKVTATITGKSSQKRTSNPADSKSKLVEKPSKKPSKISKTSGACCTEQLRKPPKPSLIPPKKPERSFIPLASSIMRTSLSSTRRRNIDDPRAPLAESESTCIENSPAVELPPMIFDRLASSTKHKQLAQLHAESRSPESCLATSHDSEASESLPLPAEYLAVTAPDGPSAYIDELSQKTSTISAGELQSPINQSLPDSRCSSEMKPMLFEDANGNFEMTLDAEMSPHNCQQALRNSSLSQLNEEPNGLASNSAIFDQTLLASAVFIESRNNLLALNFPDQENFSPIIPSEDIDRRKQKNLDDAEFNVHQMISSFNMASSGYMTSSGPLNSPEKFSEGLPELDSVEEQLCNLTMSTKASRARSHRNATSDNNVIVASQPGPSNPKQQKFEDPSTENARFPDLATYEASCQDVAYIKNQLFELQKLVNEAAAADISSTKSSRNVEDVAVERLLRENEALRKQLMEKDQIISKLKSQIQSVQ